MAVPAPFQAKQQAIRDEANRKRSEKAKEQHAVSKPWAGEEMVVEQPAQLPSPGIAKSREAKIEASQCNVGAVPYSPHARMVEIIGQFQKR